MVKQKEHAKSTGLPVNTAGALCYGLGWVTGLVFLLWEKDKRVRFHALQSIVIFGGLNAAQFFLASTMMFSVLASLLGVTTFILWLVLIFKAYEGERWKFPYVGDWVERQLKTMK